MLAKQIGKIPPREVCYIKLIEESEMTLKFYDIYFSGKTTNNSTLSKVEQFLRSEIKGDKIDPHSGLGFAILTNDTLNVVRWNKEYPILLQNQQYGFNKDYTSAKPLDIRENDVGSFCIWEIGVADHERQVWREFVDSERGEEDLNKYLAAVIEGEI